MLPLRAAGAYRAAFVCLAVLTGCEFLPDPDDEPDNLGSPDGDSTPECGDHYQFRLNSDVLLLVDQSESMFGLWWDHDGDPGTSDVTRWHSLRTVVELIVDEYDDVLDLGALLFPKAGGDGCNVASFPEVPVGAGNGDAILAELPAIDGYKLGATPLPEGLEIAVDYMKGLSGSDPRAIFLLSDGEPSCGPTLADATASARDGLEAGIPTYVVAIDIADEFVTGFNELAEAGGRPAPGPASFYNSQNEIELRAALEGIALDVVGCGIALTTVPDYPDEVVVNVAGEEVPRIDSCAGDGWRFTDPATADRIELCGSWCSRVKEEHALVDVEYNCADP